MGEKILLSEQERYGPGRDRKEQGLGHRAVCLPSLSSVALGRDKGHVWPLTALSDISRREPADHPLELYPLVKWCVDIQLPGGTGAGRQGCGPVLLFQMLWSAFVAVSSLSALESSCP